MDGGQMSRTDLKVEVPPEAETVEAHAAPAPAQPSVTRTSCLCSPTTHPGSFRCRLHRAPSLKRTKSIDSHSKSKQISPTATTTAE
ncbi:Phototropic-responsive NPH3 family protein [Hibiscus syriacus]|uniref:Phototropic-responsive NPH3 family protein n=2 Tax=Hibiscus syriacus TaxID=106335 RepID=A0A6A3BTR8_HIBSY|nr:Phototropic-responsive NPH3 family protein [Hibiscus syriacus]